jgi:hypothetical protein
LIEVLELNKSDTIAIEILTSNKSLEDDFETLGMQLDSLEIVNQPTKMRTWMAEGIDLTKQIREVFINKAKDFLKKYGENILKETCDWWNKNKDEAYDTSSMIGFITPIITAALTTAGFGVVVGVVALVAVILIRAGLNTVCPSGGKAEAILPWK